MTHRLKFSLKTPKSDRLLGGIAVELIGHNDLYPLFSNYRAGFLELAYVLYERDNAAEARHCLAEMDRLIPEELIPYVDSHRREFLRALKVELEDARWSN